ncbi:hypothetical protein [Pseudoduganella namucuonensis]|uniref:hypothetical protein n=1 Tax=Pseudoduganella namucuonensis TaxID=1035707 RepID=UPI0011606B18|nr:hypothetical protein [Pseudoduganella namucuonensis]
MTAKYWRVQWTHRDGRTGITEIEWPNVPSKEDAAIRVRTHLLGENFLLIDMPRGQPEPSVYLLHHYGYEIGTIEPVEA